MELNAAAVSVQCKLDDPIHKVTSLRYVSKVCQCIKSVTTTRQAVQQYLFFVTVRVQMHRIGVKVEQTESQFSTETRDALSDALSSDRLKRIEHHQRGQLGLQVLEQISAGLPQAVRCIDRWWHTDSLSFTDNRPPTIYTHPSTIYTHPSTIYTHPSIQVSVSLQAVDASNVVPHRPPRSRQMPRHLTKPL